MNKINQLTKNDFISLFGNVFEKTTWIAEKVFASKPFENFDKLSERFLDIFENVFVFSSLLFSSFLLNL